MLLILSTTAGSNLELGKKVEEAAGRKGIPASVLDLSELRIPLFCMRDFEAGPGADYPQLHQQLSQKGWDGGGGDNDEGVHGEVRGGKIDSDGGGDGDGGAVRLSTTFSC